MQIPCSPVGRDSYICNMRSDCRWEPVHTGRSMAMLQRSGLAAICPGNILVDATHFKHTTREEGVPELPEKRGKYHPRNCKKACQGGQSLLRWSRPGWVESGKRVGSNAYGLRRRRLYVCYLRTEYANDERAGGQITPAG